MVRRVVLFAVGLALFASVGFGAWLEAKPLAYVPNRADPAADGPIDEDLRRPFDEPSPLPSPAPDRPGEESAPIRPSERSVAEPPRELPPLTASDLEEIGTIEARTPNFRHTTNYLLIGVDRRTRRRFGRADTLLVAVFDDASGHVGVVSLPRDLYVEVPGHGPARINSTLRIGARLGIDPLDLAERVVEDTLSMPIHHVIVGDLSSFERTVDALGGVLVHVPCPIMDNFLDPRTESGRRILDVPTGTVHMDGVTAAMYVRSRHGRSDWSRARRQQAVLLGLKRRIQHAPFARWVPILNRALEDGVTTSMSRLELIELASRLADLDLSRLHGLLISHREVEGHRTSEGRAVLLPRYNAIDDALGSLFDAPAPGRPPPGRRCPAADVALR